MAKFNVSAKLEARFRTVLAQMNSLQYDACPNHDAYRTISPETVHMAAIEMKHHVQMLEDVLQDIQNEVEAFIEVRDNPPDPSYENTTSKVDAGWE